MLLQPSKPTDTILGYTLREKIGSGGYGEVWAADAPGGLSKAIKLIFGFHDESRAQRELKALNRIKQVRHPFLLSLERIDIVDGRLVVVTELAEQSLKDCFQERVAKGEIGIPREELLGYLSDAAEALDFIYESHSLLHLDVKPENLLLVGGHVKLADFGLVKDVQESLQSMMGGLTPTYAAPEMFDGQPCQASDQYSLAIVYQEMLTGQRPFSGTTPAKLALQHLHEAPDLGYLTPGDQGPLRRALAKSPSARYPDCRTFIDDLAQRRSRPRRRKPETALRKPSETPLSDAYTNTMASPMAGVVAITQKLVEEKLPPLDVAIEDAKFHPTLFIGIGQTATTVLCHLKRRFRERLGAEERHPAMRILCLDTDERSLYEALRAPGLGKLTEDEILPLPLQTSADYRAQSGSRLTWLSRRWIYNIPRSRQTEGLRPLGRLAFVDHHEKVFDRLHRVVAQATETDAVSVTAKLCEMPPGDGTPRVFIVASISGGAGSGMVADVAYTVRMVLGERGLRDEFVYGILLSSSARSSTRRDVTVANTYCCLSELYHYSQVQDYPGDPSCDLPAFDHCPTFDSTYLVDMGSDPLADEYTAMADVLAEYLFLDAATPCGTYLEACREDGMSDGEDMYLRTLGVSHSGGADGDAVSLSSHVVCHRAVSRWLRPPGAVDSADNAHDSLAARLAEVGWNIDRLTSRIHEGLNARFERRLDELLQGQLEPLCDIDARQSTSEDMASLVRSLEDLVDQTLGIDRSKSAAFSLSAKNVAESVADKLSLELASTFEQMVFAELDRSGHRLSQTERFLRNLLAQVDETAEQTLASQRVIRDELAQLVSKIERIPYRQSDRSKKTNDDDLSVYQAVAQYGYLRLGDFLTVHVKRTVAGVRRQLEQLAATLQDLRRDLSAISNQFEQQYAREERRGLAGVTAPNAVASSLFLESTTRSMDELIEELDATIQEQFLQPQGGFRKVQLDHADTWKVDLTQSLYRHARSLIAARIQVIGFDSLLRQHGVSDERIAKWIDESLKLSTPNLLTACGGKSRVVVALPRGAQGELLEAAFANGQSDQPRFLPVTDGDVAFCIEVGEIPIQQVAAKLLQTCPRSTELVSRIHTRTDINWSPLIRLE